MVQGTKYVIVTPARDEEEHIGNTIAAVASQTVRPVRWIIVNDGSTDATGKIAEEHAAQYSWISVIHRTNRGFRKSGGGVVEAFKDGYEALGCEDWDFIVKLDADLSFATDYFERCFQYFYQEPKLGIGGGEIHYNLPSGLKREANPRFHVRGATKIYRRACWEAIDGLIAAPGWDTIDEAKANMLGWKTHSFEGLPLVHFRLTGSAEGLVRDCVKHGIACHVSGYHPAFVGASCLRRLVWKPYIIGSLATVYGYVTAYLSRRPRVNDRDLIRYVRHQQLRRLCGLETFWK